MALALLIAITTPAQIDINEKSRDRWQQPERIMDSAGVQPGMVVGEAGAGTGYFTFKLSRRVGPGGTVFANDINRRSLQELESRCRREKVTNIRTILGSETEARFPPTALDRLFLVYVLHDLKKPVPLLQDLAKALKPGATLVVVEQDILKTKSRTGHFWKQERIIEIFVGAGFDLVRQENFLPRDTIFIFARARI